MAVASVSEYILQKHHIAFSRGVKVPIKRLILDLAREKVTEAVAIPQLVRLSFMYPTPTSDNVILKESKILVSLRDGFFAEGMASERDMLWKAAWNVTIDEVEHDSFYGNRFLWLVERLLGLERISKENLELLRDEYLFYEMHGSARKLIGAAWNILLKHYEGFEPAIKWFVAQVRTVPWPKRVSTRPSRDNWREPIVEG